MTSLGSSGRQFRPSFRRHQRCPSTSYGVLDWVEYSGSSPRPTKSYGVLESVEHSGSSPTNIEHDSPPVSPPLFLETLEFLIPAEQIVAKEDAVLVNTDEAGTLYMTNFRLLFWNEATGNIIELGSIPLATIERFSEVNQCFTRPSVESSVQRRLQIVGKDMRIIVFGFKQSHDLYNALLRRMRPERYLDLYAFSAGPAKFSNGNPKVRLLNEYFRLLGKMSPVASMSMVDDGSFTLSNELWRISNVNSKYNMCNSYPFALIFPQCISDEEVLQASSFHAGHRLPTVSWCHPRTGAVLARSSQPLLGLRVNKRSIADERLVAALCTQVGDGNGTRRKLYIVDARSRKHALVNHVKGGGSESSSKYFQSEIVFLGIENIHAMRTSFSSLRKYLDTHGTTSSNGRSSSFLRHGDWNWGGGNRSNMPASISALGDSGWLMHVHRVLAGSAWIATRVELESASVLVHCSDGWDQTTQLISLASLLLDPFYRTFTGFQALVEKDWLAFGHPFSDRLGMPTISGRLSRRSSTRIFTSSSICLSLAPLVPEFSHAQEGCSPIFLQWIDCVSQLLRIYPSAFQFSSAFLVDFLDCVHSCRFGNFFCNSEKKRQKYSVSESCGCLWAYLADLRATEGSSHMHHNPSYDQSRHEGPLLPSASADLVPVLWRQFHLKWACPLESQAL